MTATTAIRTPLRILYLEDDLCDRELAAKALAADGLTCDFTYAKTQEEFDQALRQAGLDLIFSDFTIPSYDGLSALALARTILPEVPFLFLSGTIELERAVEGLKSGATDCVLKGRLDQLAPAVRRALRETEFRRARQEAEEAVIAERKSSEEALRDSEARWRILFEYAPDATYLHDLNGVFVDGNKAAEQLVGYPKEEIIGKSLLELALLSGDGLARAAADLSLSVMGQPTGPGEYTLKRKNGTEVCVEIRTYPLQIGEKVLVLGIARDISERKQLEEQLRQSQKMEAVGRLAGGVAHDFNNLLAVILLNAEVLLMDAGAVGAQAQDGLTQISAAAERAANLTRQLLTFSRKQVMKAQPLVLHEVVANLTKMLHRIIGEDIDFQCDFATDLPFVEADTGMMEQVIVNLVVNSRDAMPHGGKLKLSTESLHIDQASASRNPEARAGDFVCLAVCDSGTGIAPEHLPRVFEPFFTTKEPGRGTGLGLATVYGIVKQHHGWVEVSSVVGEGTTFRIVLPAMTPARPEYSPVRSEPELRGGTETILLVEDDEPVRTITRRVLEKYRYRVFEATCAREAREVWKRHAGEIALLLTDIVMPEGANGRQLAEDLSVQQPNLKVIFMSGYSEEATDQDLGFLNPIRSWFIQKPASPGTLLDTVRQCLDDKELQPKEMVTL